MSASSTSNQTKTSWIKRHKIWSAIIGLLIFFSIIGAIGGDSSTTNTDTTNKSDTAKSAKKTATAPTTSTPKLNQAANDGKLSFTVTDIQCGLSQIEQPGDTYGINTSKTGAPYCVMNISAKNISNAAQTFDSDSQYIYDASGKQYSTDSSATIDANPSESNCMMYASVNPGVTLTCSLAYDVPAGVAPTYAMLHDSSLSNGVKVSLQ